MIPMYTECVKKRYDSYIELMGGYSSESDRYYRWMCPNCACGMCYSTEAFPDTVERDGLCARCFGKAQDWESEDYEDRVDQWDSI